jgi:hypothetical protein
MGRVEAFEIEGLDLRFPPCDHLPYHFHAVKRGQWHIRVVILRCSRRHGLFYELRWGPGPDAAERARLLEMVVRHRRRLLREWERKVVCPPNPEKSWLRSHS